MKVRANIIFRVAHASRVLAMVSSPSRTLAVRAIYRDLNDEKDCCGGTPQPARETRALPNPETSAEEMSI